MNDHSLSFLPLTCLTENGGGTLSGSTGRRKNCSFNSVSLRMRVKAAASTLDAGFCKKAVEGICLFCCWLSSLT